MLVVLVETVATLPITATAVTSLEIETSLSDSCTWLMMATAVVMMMTLRHRIDVPASSTRTLAKNDATLQQACCDHQGSISRSLKHNSKLASAGVILKMHTSICTQPAIDVSKAHYVELRLTLADATMRRSCSREARLHDVQVAPSFIKTLVYKVYVKLLGALLLLVEIEMNVSLGRWLTREI